MPRITPNQIEFLPLDRTIFGEQSPGITEAAFANLFDSALADGNTTLYYKFLEEIVEKDADVSQAIASRTSEITSKEWEVEGPNEATAEKIKEALLEIPGDPVQGFLTVDQLINAFLGSAYLTSISMNEVITDAEKIIGFNHIPSHFLTFQDAVNYPKLYTREDPMGVDFNQEKMIVHYLNPGNDPVRGYLGNAVGWQYVFKTNTVDQRLQWQQRYGKGFLLINMPGEPGSDSYIKAYSEGKRLIQNLYNVDGAVFPSNVEVEYVTPDTSEGDYFFDAEEHYGKNIAKIILGQASTSDAEDSNRSTADVHMEVLNARVAQDMDLIEDTISKQLITKVKALLNISEEDEYVFKFVVSEIDATMDKDMDIEVTANETLKTPKTTEE